MVAHGWHRWWEWVCISMLVTLLAGCTFPLVAGHSTGPDLSCRSDVPVLLAPISPIVDLAVDDQSIYLLTRANPGSVSKISRSDGEFKLLADLSAEPFGIVVDDHSIYWVEGTWQSVPDLSLKKMEKNGGEVTELWNDQGSILQLTMDEDYLYWLDSETAGIWRLSRKDGTVEQLASGLQDFSSLSVLKGTIYLGGSGGLRTLESPDQSMEMLITTDQLLQGLHVGVRDEYSAIFTGPVLAIQEQVIILDFYVANNPGMISCTDNADYIVSFPLGTGSPRIIASAQGSLGPARVFYPYLYMVGACTGGGVVNLQTGEISPLEISYDTFTLAVDKNFLFWSDQEGLKCMQRPGKGIK